MTSETFGFYVGIVYIQKGIELLGTSWAISYVRPWLMLSP